MPSRLGILVADRPFVNRPDRVAAAGASLIVCAVVLDTGDARLARSGSPFLPRRAASSARRRHPTEGISVHRLHLTRLRQATRRPGRQSTPLRASGRRRPGGGVGDCTTRLSNTHGTERRILYEFHPWSGREVAIDRVFAKGGVSVARCRLGGSAPSPLLEVPSWMFDRQTCSTVRRRERPHVDLTALEALPDLLSVVLGDADLRSSDRGQGADHAPIPTEVRPVGSVRSSVRRPTSRHAAVAQSAGPGAAAGDGSDGPHAAGTPRRPGRGSGGRDRPGAPGRGER